MSTNNIKKILGLTVLVIVLVLFFSFRHGEFAHRRVDAGSRLSESIESIVYQMVNAVSENRPSAIEQYVIPEITEYSKESILNAFKMLLNAEHYALYSVNTYGENFIKAVFVYANAGGLERQVSFLFFKDNNRLFIVERT